MGVFRVLWRGLRLRCPHCGAGKVFAGFLRVEDGCVECSHVYQKGQGDWTGSAEMTIMFSAGAAFAVALALTLVPSLSEVPLMVTGLLAWVLIFPLMFRHIKGLWVSILYLWGGRCPEPPAGGRDGEDLVRLVPRPP